MVPAVHADMTGITGRYNHAYRRCGFNTGYNLSRLEVQEKGAAHQAARSSSEKHSAINVKTSSAVNSLLHTARNGRAGVGHTGVGFIQGLLVAGDVIGQVNEKRR